MTNSDAKVSIGAGEPAPPWNTPARGRFHVSEPFVSYFPATEYPDYGDFFKIAGETIKQEPRTRVVLVHRRAVDGAGKNSCAFIVKIHRYPLVQRIRTGFRISKAENEFKSLLHLKQLGVTAVEPVAFGAERTALGLVRSCFVITRYLDAAINLAEWHGANNDKDEAMQRSALLKRLGAIFHRLHGARFFLFTAKPKNILLRHGSDFNSDLHILDTPYARTLRWWPLARWAQSRDLGYCLGSFEPGVTARDLASFYEGYLPDTLGSSAESVQRRVLRAIRAQQNLTPLSRSVHAVKRYLRQRLRHARRAKAT
ncbi:MAG: lipopolysaccharide kinase InaA family protein [Candidatus Binatia bacterium]